MGKLEPRVLTAKAIEAMRPDASGAYRVPDLRCKGLGAARGGQRQNLGLGLPDQGRGRQAPLLGPL